MYESSLSSPFVAANESESHSSGGNILARLSDSSNPDNSWYLQAFYNYHEDIDATLADVWSHAFEVEFHNYIKLNQRHMLAWGLDCSLPYTTTESRNEVSFDPEYRLLASFTAFVQDDITLLPGTLVLTLGSKFDYADYMGLGFNPTDRLSWTPDQKQILWLAASRLSAPSPRPRWMRA